MQTISTTQAEQLERHYPGATSLQDAIRAACRDGIDERRQTVKACDMREVADRSREILDRVDAIYDALDDD